MARDCCTRSAGCGGRTCIAPRAICCAPPASSAASARARPRTARTTSIGSRAGASPSRGAAACSSAGRRARYCSRACASRRSCWRTCARLSTRVTSTRASVPEEGRRRQPPTTRRASTRVCMRRSRGSLRTRSVRSRSPAPRGAPAAPRCGRTRRRRPARWRRPRRGVHPAARDPARGARRGVARPRAHRIARGVAHGGDPADDARSHRAGSDMIGRATSTEARVEDDAARSTP